MLTLLRVLKETIEYVIATLVHNMPILLLGILVAAAITVYVDPEKFRKMLLKKSNVSIPATVAFGAFTPFCACGTTAIVVAMLTTALPWGPIMAFLTSSPLMSPDKFIFISGIVSMKFAIAVTVSSVIIGLGSGFISNIIEKKSHFLDNQTRFSKINVSSDNISPESQCSCCSGTACTVEKQSISSQNFIARYKIKEFLSICYKIGIKQVLLYFAVFVAIGYLINQYVPAELITRFLGKGNIFSVPLLAVVGLPLYVTGPSSLPIINVLMEGGASSGAMLAFMITGPGTSAGVIAGITMIMKKKAIALYIAYLLVGAIILGYLYDFLLLLRPDL